jgi:hypothetical protein
MNDDDPQKHLDRWVAGESHDSERISPDFTPEELERVERNIADAIDRRVAKKDAIGDIRRRKIE